MDMETGKRKGKNSSKKKKNLTAVELSIKKKHILYTLL